MTDLARFDGRAVDALRPISIETDFQRFANGSALIRWGQTHVLCAASVEERVPHHRVSSGGGWMTAEYSMLPGSVSPRADRDRKKVSGRTAEIQRLIGRSLRAVFDLDTLGPRTVYVDCDVLQADGGTRCASITGAYVAVCLALRKLGIEHQQPVAAVSLGVVGDRVLTDLCYVEDSTAQVDLNYVSTPAGLVEVQGTAEGKPFSQAQLNEMTSRGAAACERLFAMQRDALR